MIIYGQPFSDYLAASDHIGSSTAKLALKSIQLLKDSQDGLYSVQERACHTVGRLAHMAVLEPELFKELAVTDGPINEKTGKPYGRDTKAFADWQSANPHVTVVDPWLLTMLGRMPDRVREIFSVGQSEVSIYRTLPGSGIKVKCRNDHQHENVITDLKTCEDVDRIDSELIKWKYWFQAGWYRMVNLEETGNRPTFRFVFAEKKPPYRWRIVSLAVDFMQWADNQVDDVLGKIIDAQRTGDWSDKGELDHMATLPDFLEDADETNDGDE